MVVIKVKVRQFNYFLRLKKGEGYPEGLINNATQFITVSVAQSLIDSLESVWPLSVHDIDQEKINKHKYEHEEKSNPEGS
jgi:hypothetical protein